MTDHRSENLAKVSAAAGEPVRNGGKNSTLIGRAHAELKNNIIHGHHRPGEKLRVEHLKIDYGVSGGTLREALTMLIADRLVVSEGQRGFRVKPVSSEELIDLNRIRILIEKEAIRQSIAHGDEEWEAKVVSSFHMLSRSTKVLAENLDDPALLEEWERRHRDFHLSLISAAPSEWMRYILTLTYQQYERYRHLFLAVALEFYKDRDAAAEHAELVDAVLARDADAAAASIERHVTQSIDEWVGYFEKVGAIEPRRAAGGARKAGKSKRQTS
jgi:DNA-binding GntR family transcriptional regulator